MRIVREFDMATVAKQYVDGGMSRVGAPEMPSFDHIPTEEGREASRKLWRAAFGEPSAFTARFDVMYGFATIRPELAVKVTS